MAEIVEWLEKTNLLRHAQRVDMLDERQRLQEQVSQPVLGNKSGIQNPGAITNEIRKLDKQLAAQSPRPLTADEKDLLGKKQVELEREITAGMPTHEEMRRNPAGTVHRHMRWEKANKRKINLLKNVMIQLDPESEDRDLANLERLRPHQAVDNSAATFMVNAQIPGHFAQSSQAKANWPLEMPPQGTANSVLAQAKKRTRTPEQRAAFGARMKAARANKRQVAAKEG